jgi:two-component system nitrogen regulation sensor histidine kinase NtrY
MPKPILKDNNLTNIARENINLLNELDESIDINFKLQKNDIFLISDSEQLSRVFFNLIKNSIESIQEKKLSTTNYKGKINIDLKYNDNYIEFVIVDNGVGLGVFKNDIKNILNPYFTTKEKGTGLGLAIVNKIINDHNGILNFIPLDNGAKIVIKFKKE